MALISKDSLQELADICIEEIRYAMQSTGTNASGKTAAGLFSEVKENHLTIYSNRGGFYNVESGQNPGKRPKNFKEIMKQWIKDKGLSIKSMPYSPNWHGPRKFSSPEERGLSYMAGAMAWKNKTKGSLLYRDGGRNDVFTPALENLVNKIAIKIGNDYLKKIDVIFANTELR